MYNYVEYLLHYFGSGYFTQNFTLLSSATDYDNQPQVVTEKCDSVLFNFSIKILEL